MNMVHLSNGLNLTHGTFKKQNKFTAESFDGAATFAAEMIDEDGDEALLVGAFMFAIGDNYEDVFMLCEYYMTKDEDGDYIFGGNMTGITMRVALDEVALVLTRATGQCPDDLTTPTLKLVQ